jgi:light-regulated signal transduction histidine kinase (bacteriophytochrome)
MSVSLGNLLGNAWKYTQKTEHPLIEFGAFGKDGKRIFFVRDNGVGFDMCQAGRLFAPFQRLHSEKEFIGIGLGLAIVERAIKRHGGKIWAEGEVGKGAVFYFTLDEQ